MPNINNNETYDTNINIEDFFLNQKQNIQRCFLVTVTLTLTR